jgi:hypothetical protein
VPDAFFEPVAAGEFVATAATAGPWSGDSQHGGPPSALAAHVMEQHEAEPGLRLGRVSVDILRPVPVGKLTVRVRTVRPGRRVSLLETVVASGDTEVLHARGWRLARPSGPVPAIGAGEPAGPLPGETGMLAFPGAHTDGYLSAIEWRFAAGGGFSEEAAASVWMRPRVPLLPGAEMSPMARALLVSDSGSGVSAALDPGRFIFINVDLTVVLTRDPAGEWVRLDSATTIGTDGTGLTDTALADRAGHCGRAMQTLLVAPRPAG